LGGSYFGMVAASIAAVAEEIGRGLGGPGGVWAGAVAVWVEAGEEAMSEVGAGWAVTADPPTPIAASSEKIVGKRSMRKMRERGLKKVSRQC